MPEGTHSPTEDPCVTPVQDAALVPPNGGVWGGLGLQRCSGDGVAGKGRGARTWGWVGEVLGGGRQGGCTVAWCGGLCWGPKGWVGGLWGAPGPPTHWGTTDPHGSAAGAGGGEPAPGTLSPQIKRAAPERRVAPRFFPVCPAWGWEGPRAGMGYRGPGGGVWLGDGGPGLGGSPLPAEAPRCLHGAADGWEGVAPPIDTPPPPRSAYRHAPPLTPACGHAP